MASSPEQRPSKRAKAEAADEDELAGVFQHTEPPPVRAHSLPSSPSISNG